MRFHWIDLIAGAGAAALTTLCSQAVDAHQKSASKQSSATVDGDWPLYCHDLAGTGYSPLAQITAQNAGALTQATGVESLHQQSACKPIMVNDVA
jgi:glucose dehydrogenase